MHRSLAAFLAALLCCAGAARAQQAPFQVGANVALASLITIGDAHLQTMVDSLEAVASTDEARSGDWARVRPLMEELRANNVPAVLFFARRDGSYWTLDGGKQKANVSDRPYFGRVMKGQVVIGDLVVSRSTGKPVAVNAVPVKGPGGNVVGLLGGSIYLDALSAQIKREMDLGPGDLFWAIDANGVIALHSDQTAIFVQPGKMSPQLQHVTQVMLTHASGSQTYEFRGRMRTVVFRLSPLTGWRYGFGIIR